jgi:hypothetical protein
LETYPQQFYFKIASDEGIISSGSKLEPLQISETLNSNDSSYEPLMIYDPAAVQD